MPTQVTRRPTLYGYPSPQKGLQQEPLIQQRAPTTADSAELGAIWIFQPAQTPYFLVDNSGGVNTWFTPAAGGTGVFSSLTVNPGPVNLVTVGSGAVSIGNSLNSFPITIDGGGSGIDINGNGSTLFVGADNNANTVHIGSSNVGAATLIQGGLAMRLAGNIEFPSTTQAGTSYAVQSGDYQISINSAAGAYTVTLPAAPSGAAKVYVIYDAFGHAAANNITIDGNGNNIAAGGALAATVVLTTNYQSITLYWDGLKWLGQLIA